MIWELQQLMNIDFTLWTSLVFYLWKFTFLVCSAAYRFTVSSSVINSFMIVLFVPLSNFYFMLGFKFHCSLENNDLYNSRQKRYTDLQQVGANALVSALLSHLFSQPCDLIRGLGNVFSTLDQSTLVATASTYKARHLSHQQGHSLSCCNNIITLRRKNRHRQNWFLESMEGSRYLSGKSHSIILYKQVSDRFQII